MESNKYTGYVKWFNNKSGYGFITIINGDKTGTDVFAHHSSIRVGAEQYKYLVQGEYVEFCLAVLNSPNTNHPYQATDVCGISGGKLMCETIHDAKVSHNQYQSQSQDQSQTQRQSKPQHKHASVKRILQKPK